MRMARLTPFEGSRRSRALLFLVTVTTISIVVTVNATEFARARMRKREVRRRRRKFRTMRLNILQATSHFLDFEFKTCFRMDRTNFESLLRTLEGGLQCDHEMARRSSGAEISPSTRLGIALRMLAGASYIDVFFAFKVSPAAAYANTHRVVRRINEALALPGVPFRDDRKLQRMARAFTQSRASPLFGCVGALDGILIPIRKPRDDLCPRKYFCRKGYYALPVQVVCDSSYRFLFMSALTAGATHDNLAFSVSNLSEALTNNALPDGYWIAGDETYQCSDSLLTPWPSSLARDDSAKDAFNFYQSSLRIHIEQSFGQLVRRFGILWRPLQFNIHSVFEIVHACMCVHNFLIDEREGDDRFDARSLVESAGGGDAEFAEWWSRTSASSGSSRGRRRDLERSGLREHLTEHLRLRGDTRPL
jgi:hypothetical protein